jgi:predicted dehydrogenase
MTDPVRIALIGNSFASRVQLPALRWAGGNEVVGLAGYDGDKARATAERWGIPLGTGDWREVLALEPDLALLATPVDLHHEMALAALETGCAVLCEKPFAMNVAQGEEMVAAAEGRAAWIDHQLRWGPPMRRLRELVADGYLGEPYHLRVEMFLQAEGWSERPWRWWFDAARGGGMLGAIGSHLLDLVRWIWGEVDAVRCELETFVKEREDADGNAHRVTADEYAGLRLHLANGALGELTTAFVVPSDESFYLQLTGSEGALRLVDGERLYAGKHGAALEEVVVEPGRPTAASYGMEDHGIFARCLPLYLRDLVQAVSAGRTTLDQAATFTDGLAVQRILDAARSSSAKGGWTALH